jgi:hypothetical protein
MIQNALTSKAALRNHYSIAVPHLTNYKKTVTKYLNEYLMKRPILTLGVIVVIAVLATTAFLNMSRTQGAPCQTSNDLTTLQAQYDILKAQYDNLQGNYTAMLNAYNDLQSQSRGEAYDALRAQYDQYVTNYQELKDKINLQAFALESGGEGLITPADPAVLSLVQNITGKTNSSDTNPNWNAIKDMYEWVKDNIKYRDDGLYPILPNDPAEGAQLKDQMVQFANETIALKSGDCDCIAVLLASMIRAYNPHFAAEAIWITGSSAGHIAVAIPVAGHKLVILDPLLDYYSHDLFGNIAFNDISGELLYWLNLWRPSMGNDVYVYRVFSDYIDKSFGTTNDYITWMYNR